MYKTSDLYLAAFLKASGHKIETIDRGQRKVYFHFEDVDETVVTGFYNDESVGALTYKNAINNLKTMIFRGDK